MADLIKELKEAMVEGVHRLIQSDQAFKQIGSPLVGKAAGSGTPMGGGNTVTEDQRATTGYANGQTTVAFTVGLSEIDGDDTISM